MKKAKVRKLIKEDTCLLIMKGINVIGHAENNQQYCGVIQRYPNQSYCKRLNFLLL